MFNKDTNLIFEAYQTTLNEGKMKDIATAIEMGDDVDEIIKDLKLDDTEQVRAYITKERDDFYEKGERADQIDAEDMESCEEDDDMEHEDDEPDTCEEDELTDDPSVPQDMVKALQEIAGELKRLNQYVDFMTTGRGAQGGFAQSQDKEQKFVR